MSLCPVQPLGSRPAEREHVVQFYEDEGFLAETVAEFVGPPLAKGDTALLIATDGHQKAFAKALKARGLDVRRLAQSRRLTLLDARELQRLLSSGRHGGDGPFRKYVAGTIQQIVADQPTRPLHVYGEVVNLMWRDGDAENALQLEASWHRLTKEVPISVLCSYEIANFNRTTGRTITDVCNLHDRAIPAESYDENASRAARRTAVLTLQQRAQQAETELRHRQALEQALRMALAARRHLEHERDEQAELARTAREDADRLAVSREDLAAAAAHKLRTPLNAVLGWAQMLATGRFEGEELQHAIDVIARNARAMAEAVSDLVEPADSAPASRSATPH